MNTIYIVVLVLIAAIVLLVMGYFIVRYSKRGRTTGRAVSFYEV